MRAVPNNASEAGSGAGVAGVALSVPATPVEVKAAIVVPSMLTPGEMFESPKFMLVGSPRSIAGITLEVNAKTSVGSLACKVKPVLLPKRASWKVPLRKLVAPDNILKEPLKC
jgi:hypothetical protein